MTNRWGEGCRLSCGGVDRNVQGIIGQVRSGLEAVFYAHPPGLWRRRLRLSAWAVKAS